jgi:hypothetical protein
MTGKLYYLTKLGDWRRHASRFANSHYLALDAPQALASDATPTVSALVGAQQAAPADTACSTPTAKETSTPHCFAKDVPTDATPILVLVEADEGVHLSLEDDVAFTALPHPLAQKPIPENVRAALAQHGVAPGATTFDAAEALARVHPILRHRVF